MFARLDPVRRKTAKALIIFLATMAVLTLMNNLLTEMTVPVIQKISPQRGALEKRFDASGTLEAASLHPLYPEPGVRIAQVHVRDGQPVAQGDPLITLDEDSLLETMLEKQSAYDKAKQAYDWAFADVSPAAWRRYELAQKNLDRARDAYLRDDTEDEAEKRKRETALTEAQIALNRITEMRDLIQKEQALEEALEALDKARYLYDHPVYYAQCDATVMQVNVKAGDTASASAALTWADMSSPLSLTVYLSGEEAASVLQPGDTAQITAGGTTYRSSILTAVENPDSLEVTLLLPEGAGAPGMSADVRISKRTSNYDLLVPLTALHQDNTGYYVYRLTTRQSALGMETRVSRADVNVIDTDATRAALQGGISFGDMLVARSDRAIADGDRVRSGED